MNEQELIEAQIRKIEMDLAYFDRTAGNYRLPADDRLVGIKTKKLQERLATLRARIA